MCSNKNMMIENHISRGRRGEGGIIYFLWVFRIIKAGETALYYLLPESHTRLGLAATIYVGMYAPVPRK